MAQLAEQNAKMAELQAQINSTYNYTTSNTFNIKVVNLVNPLNISEPMVI